MVYTTEADVYKTTGFSSEVIQKLSGLPVTDVTTLVTGWISDAEDELNADVGLPHVIRHELHIGDGDSIDFDLGPRDESYVTVGDFDPTNGVSEVYEVLFDKYRMKTPYPHDCDEFTEYSSTTIAAAWGTDTGTLTSESTTKIAGSYSIKAVMASAGYIQYPKAGTYLNKNIDMFTDFFLWFRTNRRSATYTVRLYDKDDNYKEETFSASINDVGEYHWLDIDTFSNGLGSIDWDDSKLQYIRIYVSEGCTIYVDNMCFADSWSFTAPLGSLHVSLAENISGEGPPSTNYPYYVTYGYNPTVPNVPGNIKKACEWLVGIYAIEYLRGIKWGETDFRLMADSMEPDTPIQKSALLGLRDKWLQNYNRCLISYGGQSYGTVG